MAATKISDATTITPTGSEYIPLGNGSSKVKVQLSNVWQKSQTLGQIFSDNFARASLGSNYTTTGSTATFSCDGTKLNISGGVGTNGEYIIYNQKYTNSEDYTIKCSFKVIGPINASSFGQGIIVKANSSTGNANNFICTFDGSSNASQGKINFYFAGANTLTSPNGMTILVNDIIDMTLTRNKNTFTCTIFNETSKLSNSFTYTYQLVFSQSIVIPPCVQFGLLTQGGVYQVGNVGNPFSYTCDVAIGADILFLSDSIFSGYFNTELKYRPPAILADLDRGKKIVVYGVQGTTTSDMINCQNEIVALLPKVVFMCIGKNDSVNATAIANMTTLKTALEALGATVIFTSIINATTLNTLIISTFSGTNQYVDVYTAINGVTGMFADGTTHFTRLGALRVARNLYTSCRNIFSVANTAVFDDGYIINQNNNIKTVTTTYTVLDGDYTVKGDATSAAFTITLPPVANSINRILYISKIDSSGNAITIKGNASELIDGSNTQSLAAQWNTDGLHCDGTTWKIISKV